MIAEAVAKLPPGKYDTGATAKDWFARRIKNQRIKNRTVCRSFTYRVINQAEIPSATQGPETWRSSRGTEHKPSAY